MGSISAMSSIDRFIQRHPDALAELVDEVPAALVALDGRIMFRNEIHALAPDLCWTENGEPRSLALERIDIDRLIDIDEEQFGGCCEMGY